MTAAGSRFAHARKTRSLRSLGSVLRSSLLPIGDAYRIERSPDHVIAHTGQIFHAATADQHNRVLLQIVANPRNVGRHLDTIRQPHTRHFTQRGVRFLGSLRVHARTYASLLRTSLQRRAGRLIPRPLAASFHQLIKGWHSLSCCSSQLTSAHPQRGLSRCCAFS